MDWFNFELLQPLLEHVDLHLSAKRALACVNKVSREVVNQHLEKPELYVADFDCTATNARWILRQLMQFVPQLLVCPRGETFLPRMRLDQLAECRCVRVVGPNAAMTPTAAYFLGHALAESEVDCYVRLTTGVKKRIRALRENSRVALTPEETFQEIDQRVLSGALLANAERRVVQVLVEHVSNNLNLSMLSLDDPTIGELGEVMRLALSKGQVVPNTIDLSCNPFGEAGLRELLVPSYGAQGVVNRSSSRMHSLNLTGVPLRCAGVKLLAEEVLAVGRLAPKCLYLAKVDMEREGLVALVNTYANLSKGFKDTSPAYVLEVLDLSDNPFTSSALLPLTKQLAFPSLKVLKLRGLNRAHGSFWGRMGYAIAKDDFFPCISSVCYDPSIYPLSHPVQRAVELHRAKRRASLAQTKWNDWAFNNTLEDLVNRDVEGEAARFARRLARRRELSADDAPSSSSLADDGYTGPGTDDEEDELMAEHAEREARRCARVAD